MLEEWRNIYYSILDWDDFGRIGGSIRMLEDRQSFESAAHTTSIELL